MNPTNRLLHIDAMRAYAILIVTFTHYFNYIGVSIPDLPIIGLCFHTFVVASFFWRSGYIFFKPLEAWENNRICMTMGKRFCQLVLSTLAVIGINALIYAHSYPNVWNDGFGGYYFNSALFDVIALTLILLLIFKNTPRLFFLAMSVLPLVAYLTLFIIKGNYSLPHYMNWREALLFFPFFSLGIFCRKYDSRFVSIVRNRCFIATNLIIFALSLAILNPMRDYFIGNYPVIHEFAKTISSSISGLALFTAIFFSSRYISAISKRNIFNRTVLLIGRRSLDIYLFHYIFINSHWISDNILSRFIADPDSGSVPRFLIGVMISLIIAFMSIIAGSIARRIIKSITTLFK
ncbi:MAG: acyltransferase family protein [Muribaculaceae bacterium]|nr:acyltransferase family protein [Muribaculaceae bacterium]